MSASVTQIKFLSQIRSIIISVVKRKIWPDIVFLCQKSHH